MANFDKYSISVHLCRCFAVCFTPDGFTEP